MRCRTRRCGLGATSGSTRACSTRSRPKRSPRSIGSSASISMTSRSTGRYTRPRTGVKAPARTPPIVGSWAGNGRSPRNVTASRSAGRSTARTVTTCACSNPPSTRSISKACSSTSTRCTSIAATTPARCANGSATPASTSSRSNFEAPRNPARNNRYGSDCDGSSKRPTPGGRTTASSDATPTASHATDTPRCVSRPRSSSSGNSSTWCGWVGTLAVARRQRQGRDRCSREHRAAGVEMTTDVVPPE